MLLAAVSEAFAFTSSSPVQVRWGQHAARAPLVAADSSRPSKNNRNLRLAKLAAEEADIKRAAAVAEVRKQAEVARYRASLLLTSFRVSMTPMRLSFASHM